MPARPNLEHLKSQAKDLLEAFRRKDADALVRVRTSLPSAHGADDAKLRVMAIALHDAQSVVAREYGFPSWTELKKHVEAATTQGHDEGMAANVRALMEQQAKWPLPQEVVDLLTTARSESAKHVTPSTIPTSLPMVALRNAVLAVGAIAPLHIARPSSLEAIARVKAREDRLLVIFSQKDEANETPSAADVHPIGCVVRLVSRLDNDAGSWIVVHALQWAKLEGLDGSTATISPFEVTEEQSAAVDRLDEILRQRVRVLVATLPNAASMLEAIGRMSPLELADSTMANLPCSVESKARYASEPSLVGRLSYLLTLMT